MKIAPVTGALEMIFGHNSFRLRNFLYFVGFLLSKKCFCYIMMGAKFFIIKDIR